MGGWEGCLDQGPWHADHSRRPRLTPATPQVVCTRGTLEAAQRAQREGRPLWRVSSTVFSQIGSDCLLRPLGPFATEAACAAYPDTLCGEQVKAELAAINLSGTSAQD